MPINLPENQHFEESEISETFINYRTNEGRVVEASIEKKGNNQAFAYTLKVTLEKNKQSITKKRSISAYEYIDYKQQAIPGMKQLKAQRICTMQDGLYMVIDYFPGIEGQPMICIIQLDEAKLAEMSKRIQLPEYLEIESEITDQPEYQPIALAKKPEHLSSLNVLAAVEDEEEKKSN